MNKFNGTPISAWERLGPDMKTGLRNLANSEPGIGRARAGNPVEQRVLLDDVFGCML
jgi:hypothetical protein